MSRKNLKATNAICVKKYSHENLTWVDMLQKCIQICQGASWMLPTILWKVKYGPMFGCISCHIANYIRSVDAFDQNLQTKLEEKYSNPTIFLLCYINRIIM